MVLREESVNGMESNEVGKVLLSASLTIYVHEHLITFLSTLNASTEPNEIVQTLKTLTSFNDYCFRTRFHDWLSNVLFNQNNIRCLWTSTSTSTRNSFKLLTMFVLFFFAFFNLILTSKSRLDRYWISKERNCEYQCDSRNYHKN